MSSTLPTRTDFPVSTTENPSLRVSLTLYDVLIPLIGTLILVLNSAVVISTALILRGRVIQPRTTYMFLGNMALADCVTGVAVLFGKFYPTEIRNDLMCAIQLGMIVSSTIASVWSVGLVAIDRFLYIVHGLKYQFWLYPARAWWLILGTWILGIVVGFLPAAGWVGETEGGRVCWLIRLAPPELMLLITVVGASPIIIVIILYSIILYHAIRKAAQLRRADREAALKPGPPDSVPTLRCFRVGGPTGVSAPSKWKAIKVVLFTTGSFILTWMPFFVACSVHVFCVHRRGAAACKQLETAIASPLAILGFFNSLLNPIIYAWWNNNSFRGFVRKVLCKKQLAPTRKDVCARADRRLGVSASKTSTSDSSRISALSTGSSYVTDFPPPMETSVVTENK